uniref:Hexosyltransferase n=2 Tax=Gadus morhua TaxID=8049 RepID=A0A8C4Z4U9_GADMO
MIVKISLSRISVSSFMNMIIQGHNKKGVIHHLTHFFLNQEMEHGGTSAVLGYGSCRRCFVLILIVAATIILYSTNRTDWGNEWKPKWLTFKKVLSDTNSTSMEIGNWELGIGNTTQLPQSSTALPAPVPYVSPGPYSVEYPYDYHFSINQPERCNQLRPFVVLIVPVGPENTAHRINIRNTWGNQNLLLQDKVVSLFFLLGHPSSAGNAAKIQQQVMEESKEYGDLLQSDFLDCYKNLTIKTMVMMEWLQTYCTNATYAMKIDSDMFLNVPNLISMLSTAKKENYLTGLVAHGAAVLRSKSTKWYLPPSAYPESQYPPYALGLGYVFSLDLPKKIVEASRHVRPVYIEDVYVGLCMRHLQIVPTDPPDYKFHVFPLKYNRCSFSRIIATTIKPSTDVQENWKDFSRPGPYC